MKKYFKAVISLVLVTLMCLSLFGCAQDSKGPIIQFEKKYVLGDNFYVFYSDGTGYYEIHQENNDYTLSGKIEFRWETASDNMVYLFATNRIDYDDHTEGKSISILTLPLVFGKDFFTYTKTSGYTMVDTSCARYIVEGSDLEKAIG